MRDDVTDIAAYYNDDPQREHWRLERHQLEYDLTWRDLDKYLPAEGSILEVGAATGRYTLELARRGYAIAAVDMSSVLLEEARKSNAEQGLERQVRFVVADARDLGEVTQKNFDAALLMGPLYHLIVEAERKQALSQVWERWRPGGVLFSSFISLFGIMGDLIKDLPYWIEDQPAVRSYLERGTRPADAPRGGFRGYFAQVSEIAPLHEAVGFETITLAGVEPAISADDETYNRLEGKQRQLWLDILYEISAESSTLGASRHLLYIGRKNRRTISKYQRVK